MKSPDSPRFPWQTDRSSLEGLKPNSQTVELFKPRPVTNFTPKIISHVPILSRGYGSPEPEEASPIVKVKLPLDKAPPSSTGRRTCNCKRSNCLKLYCDCFASGEYCSNCNCDGCYNNYEGESYRKDAIRVILARNPTAFRPKIITQPSPIYQEFSVVESQSVKHNKGCACRRSGCLKKYCECFNAGIVCSDNCKCSDCMNCNEIKQKSSKHLLSLKEDLKVRNVSMNDSAGGIIETKYLPREHIASVLGICKANISILKTNHIVSKNEINLLKEESLEGKVKINLANSNIE